MNQLKYRVYFGRPGEPTNAREKIEVYAFNIRQAMDFAEKMRVSATRSEITKVEQIRIE